jgi:hypothetical protein
LVEMTFTGDGPFDTITFPGSIQASAPYSRYTFALDELDRCGCGASPSPGPKSVHGCGGCSADRLPHERRGRDTGAGMARWMWTLPW